jgi:general secretion pathway protein A
MQNPRMQALYGLKFNPFLNDLPLEALYESAPLQSFLTRCDNHMTEGGFALLTGAPGLGKSVVLRLLDARLSRLRDVMVRTITYPQCRIGDFYRELGDAFSVPLSWSNRWGSFKMVRDKWQAHIETTRIRPVLLVDEAQETLPVLPRRVVDGGPRRVGDGHRGRGLGVAAKEDGHREHGADAPVRMAIECGWLSAAR